MAIAEIPEKLFFRIGEVCDIAGLEAYVLRFWETEFKFLSPQKSKSGHRVYRKKDVETVMQIKELLYDRGFTIAGARKQLGIKSKSPEDRDKVLTHVRNELQSILTLLERKT